MQHVIHWNLDFTDYSEQGDRYSILPFLLVNFFPYFCIFILSNFCAFFSHCDKELDGWVVFVVFHINLLFTFIWPFLFVLFWDVLFVFSLSLFLNFNYINEVSSNYHEIWKWFFVIWYFAWFLCNLLHPLLIWVPTNRWAGDLGNLCGGGDKRTGLGFPWWKLWLIQHITQVFIFLPCFSFFFKFIL